MRVLVIGSGGREHALVWKIAQSPLVEAVLAAPGSAGMSREAQCFPSVSGEKAADVIELCRAQKVDLVVIGPEQPLVAGLADALRAAGIAAFGPSARAAQLEGSKSFAKEFMARHKIPTAQFATFSDLAQARAYVEKLGGPCVVKADGLAAGKGVAVCEGPTDALAALDEIMGARRFGEAGDKVVIEERLVGQEVSYYAITDGERIVTLAAAQDHKRVYDGDQGENTGGMGAYSPTPALSAASEKRVLEEIVHPTIAGMARDGIPFVGVLFVGLMIAPDGTPRVIEYNVRFGDPETQPLMVRMRGDLVPLLDGAARGQLDPSQKLDWADTAVCVVIASRGYPRSASKGDRIRGLDEAAARDAGVVIFHSGTKQDETGAFVTNGGRVLGVTARGATVAEAQKRAYAAVACLHFDGMHYRRDIANRALAS